jgi:hypothetical protein
MSPKYNVKPAEFQNSGFDEAFANRPSVTKDEVAQHFQNAMPQVEETVLGVQPKGTPYPEEYKNIEAEIMNRYAPEMAKHHEVYRDTSNSQSVRNEAHRNVENLRTAMMGEVNKAIPDRQAALDKVSPKIKPTQFGKYTLPGGENYREVLLKSPEQEGGTFQSSHWDDPNVLAHLRLADRTGPNGEKILHVEEIQSDWGQEGKKKGFRQPPDPAKETPLQEAKENAQFAWEKARSNFLKGHEDYQKTLQDRTMQMAERWGLTPEEVAADQAKSAQEWASMTPRQKLEHAHSEFSRSENPTELPHYAARDAEVAAAQARDKAQNDLFAYHKSIDKGLPIAPYVTKTEGWTDLALKRALKEAAEGGYDKMVWTPGAEQAKRYSLSNQVDRIAYDPEQKEFSYVQKGVNGWQTHDENVEPHELAGIIGKEAADKLLAQEVAPLSGNHVLEAPDLEFGGEGMKGYYDKIVPKRLQELVKKHDPEVKVGYTDVMLPPKSGMGHNNPPIQAPGITITPKMRESILKGQTAFKRGGFIPPDVNHKYAKGGIVQGGPPIHALHLTSKFGNSLPSAVNQAKAATRRRP